MHFEFIGGFPLTVVGCWFIKVIMNLVSSAVVIFLETFKFLTEYIAHLLSHLFIVSGGHYKSKACKITLLDQNHS